MGDDIKARVSQAEREIDDYFERELRIQGIYRPALIDAMLDVAEKLVTGHRAPGDKYDAAVRALHVNVADGLNWSLRRAGRLGSDDRRAIPSDLDQMAHGCISDGMAYPFVESAFYSFWKGYATVAFATEKEILFTPTGGRLDARLRRHPSKDGMEREIKAIKANPLLDPGSPVAGKFVKSLMEGSRVERVGGIIWDVDRDVIREVAETMAEFFTGRVGDTEIKTGGVSLSGLVKGVGVVCAVSEIHSLVSILLSDDPTDVSTSVNWPSLVRPKTEWLRWFDLLSADEHVLSALTFDAEDKAGDVAITPLVPIDSENLGVVPSLAMRSNWPRNVLILLAKRFTAAYSAYSALKEDRLLAAFRESHGDLVRATKVRLPEWQGRQLPDIDMVVADTDEQLVGITEVKWQLSASETRDVIARNDYLKKGAEQLARIREFLSQNPSYLLDRGVLRRVLDADKAAYLLLCKGHLGSEDVIRPGMVMADWDVFGDHVGTFPLAEVMRRLSAYDYLPIEGRDFTVDVTRLQFGEWVVGWKQFHALDLPPDNETEELEALYRSAYKFLPRDR